jgi:hypothetical protein
VDCLSRINTVVLGSRERASDTPREKKLSRAFWVRDATAVRLFPSVPKKFVSGVIRKERCEGVGQFVCNLSADKTTL